MTGVLEERHQGEFRWTGNDNRWRNYRKGRPVAKADLVGLERAAAGGFSHAGVTTTVEYAGPSKILEALNVDGHKVGVKFRDAEGRRVGDAWREMYTEGDKVIVVHSRFDLNEDYQGKGIGRAYLEHSLAEYRKMGVAEVRLEAHSSKLGLRGAVVWAKLGFDFHGQPQPRLADQMERFTKRKGKKWPDGLVDRVRNGQASVREVLGADGGETFLSGDWGGNSTQVTWEGSMLLGDATIVASATISLEAWGKAEEQGYGQQDSEGAELAVAGWVQMRWKGNNNRWKNHQKAPATEAPAKPKPGSEEWHAEFRAHEAERAAALEVYRPAEAAYSERLFMDGIKDDDAELMALEQRRNELGAKVLAARQRRDELVTSLSDDELAGLDSDDPMVKDLKARTINERRKAAQAPERKKLDTSREAHDELEYLVEGGLSGEADDALYQWRSNGYATMQASAASGKPNADVLALDAAMVPADRSVTLYRGMNGVDRMRDGDVATPATFQAASTDPVIAMGFSKSSGAVVSGVRTDESFEVMRLNVPKGHKLLPVPESPELEVILSRGSTFTVRGRSTLDTPDGPITVVDVDVS